jgi:hypothetical protein
LSSRHLILALVAMLCTACADSTPTPSRLFSGYLTVWNRNSVSPEQPTFFEILELHVHYTADFSGGTSLLEQPLAIDATIAVDFTSEQYVTVVRRRNTGQNIALTTGSHLVIDSSCYVLEVFDEAFRFNENGDVALPALVAAGKTANCSTNTNDGGSGDGGDGDGGGGDPAPGD